MWIWESFSWWGHSWSSWVIVCTPELALGLLFLVLILNICVRNSSSCVQLLSATGWRVLASQMNARYLGLMVCWAFCGDVSLRMRWDVRSYDTEGLCQVGLKLLFPGYFLFMPPCSWNPPCWDWKQDVFISPKTSHNCFLRIHCLSLNILTHLITILYCKTGVLPGLSVPPSCWITHTFDFISQSSLNLAVLLISCLR